MKIISRIIGMLAICSIIYLVSAMFIMDEDKLHEALLRDWPIFVVMFGSIILFFAIEIIRDRSERK